MKIQSTRKNSSIRDVKNILKVFLITAVSNLIIHGNNVNAEPGPLATMLLGSNEEENNGFDIRGWLSQGFTFNPSNSSSFNGPISFNDRADEYQMNQAYLIIEKTTQKGGDEWSIGGRFDLLYGTDAQYSFSTKWDDNITSDNYKYYKLALPQAYLETNIPLLNGVSLKAGHFYTPIGYEVVTAPDNFFYSHAYTMQYGEPFTHWGALASTSFLDGKLTLTSGAVRGWDNFRETADRNLAFLGGFSITPWDTTTLTTTIISGNEGVGLNRTMYSTVLSQKLSESFSYVLQHDYGQQEVDEGENAKWYGINQYLFYNASDCITPGMRFEWFRDDAGARVLGLRSGAGGSPSDYFALSLGVNIKPHELVVLRPEIRYDWQNIDGNGNKAFNRGSDTDQVLLAMDAIVKF
jgi:hypothetical protein